MHNNPYLLTSSSAAALMLLVVGCAAPPNPGEDLGHATEAVKIGNGGDVNGGDVNGGDVNGGDVNGGDVNGGDVNGGDVNGNALTDVKLEAGNITAVNSDNEVLSGPSLVGATFQAKLMDGTPIHFRIDAVEDFNWHSPLPADYPNDPVYAYTISVKYSGRPTWSPICGTDHKQPRRTTPLAGRWNYAQGVPGGGDWIDDPDAVTFACEGYVLYKCIALGYAPWFIYGGHDLADYYQACTRMMRADYCGDGRSWTRDGIWINVYDNISLQHDDADWVMEAEWTGEGARCLAERRLQNKQHKLPDCTFELPAASCGTPPDWTHTLLVNEYQAD